MTDHHKASEPAEKDCGFLGLLRLGDKLKVSLVLLR
jgi:hypothetical protein